MAAALFHPAIPPHRRLLRRREAHAISARVQAQKARPGPEVAFFSYVISMP